MELLRILSTLIVLLFSTLIHSHSDTNSNQGIAFVHGTRDHREDAYGGIGKLISYKVYPKPWQNLKITT